LKALPPTELLILTMHESEQIVREVLDAGAQGYVLKSDSGRDLVVAAESFVPPPDVLLIEDFEGAAVLYSSGRHGAARDSARTPHCARARDRTVAG
jgi:hypothetical protein